MLTLCRMLGNSRTIGRVGVEIEAEFMEATSAPGLSHTPSGWQSKNDGSLRYTGREFCTVRPWDLESIETKVKKLCDVLNEERFSLIKDSPRAGVHVHLNVCDYGINEYFCSVLGYWLLEDLLIKFCGEETRAGNLYCMRVSDTESIVTQIFNALKSSSSSTLFSRQPWSHRYYSQNLSSLKSKTSIEYRGMRGTTDHTIINTWIRALCAIHDKSKAFKTPDKLFSWYEDKALNNPDDLLGTLFEESFVETLKGIEGYGDLVKTNLDLLDQFAFAHKDWETWQKKVEESLIPLTISSPDEW